MKAIIPCAGLGTRMGMKPDESKEMLFLNGEGVPCIDYAFKQCADSGLDPLVVTRKEKRDLIDYCRLLGVDVITISSEGEWANSVLMSCDFWDEENNILILPDTRWSNEKALSQLINSEKHFALGLHLVHDPENWGILSQDYVIEKPKHLEGPHLAWGLIKFSNFRGKQFFGDLIRNKLASVGDCAIVNIGSFKDLTRVKI